MSIVSEILYFILIGIIILHSLKFHGKIYTIRIILVGFLMGFIIENAGVVQGSYTEWGYLFYIPGSFVPLVTQIGWIVVTYISISLAGTIFKAWPILKRHFSLAATITALIATCWDIVVDPYAVLHGNWVWTSQAWGPRHIGWLGVPIINWIAWFFCIFGWTLSIYYINSKEKDWSPKKQVGIQVVAIVFTGLILLIGVIITIYLLEGNIIPLWNPPAFPSNYHW